MYRIKKIVADFGSLLGFYSRKSLLRTWPSDSFLALTYHRVGNNRFFPALSTEIFSRQIFHLHQNFAVMSLSDILAFRADKRPLPPLTLAITFDDGYSDTYTMAFPILQKHALKAAVFPATASIEGAPLWTDRAVLLSRQIRKEAEKKSSAWKNIVALCLAHAPQFNMESSSNELKELLKSLPVQKAQELVSELEKTLATSGGMATEFPPAEMMSWNQLRELAQAGWSIGAHTHNHGILSLLDENSARNEIILSRNIIQEKIGVAPDIFCYPNGGEKDFNGTTIRLLKEAGFRCALTTIEGLNTPETDAFCLRRLWTTESSISLFARRLWTTVRKGRT